MTNFVDEEFLKQYFIEGVNVIGNAQSLQQKEYGKIIDSRKTIRFNWPKLDNKTSKRLDCIWCSFPQHIPNDYKFDILFSSNKKTHNNRYQYLLLKEFVADCANRVNSKSENKKASNGLVCLHLLDMLNIKDVYVFGFDWKETPTLTSKPNKRIITKENDHDYGAEKTIALSIIEKNNWKLYQ